ncbi:MAG: DNA-binding protein [Lachnospiraceae bacterium]|nr:DNA-binding protein [Lachnospiraceae bacterium]
MDKILRQSLLYDFYGELLTEHQKTIYEDIIVNDLSYTEVAREEGISRQGVYDLVKRCDKLLEEYEDKLQLVEKFQHTKQMVADMKRLAKEIFADLDLPDDGAKLDDEALLREKNERMKQRLEDIIAISTEILDTF